MIGSANETNHLQLCPRCNSNPVFFRVRSDIMDVNVCFECGVEAASLGLIVNKLFTEQYQFPTSNVAKKSA